MSNLPNPIKKAAINAAKTAFDPLKQSNISTHFGQIMTTTSLDGTVKHWHVPAFYHLAAELQHQVFSATTKDTTTTTTTTTTVTGTPATLTALPPFDMTEVSHSNLHLYLLQTVNIKGSIMTNVSYSPHNFAISCAVNNTIPIPLN